MQSLAVAGAFLAALVTGGSPAEKASVTGSIAPSRSIAIVAKVRACAPGGCAVHPSGITTGRWNIALPRDAMQTTDGRLVLRDGDGRLFSRDVRR